MSNQEENNVMDFLNTSLERQLNWIAAADSKVPAVFGINMAMLAILCALCPTASGWSIPQAIISSIAGIGLVGSVVFLGLVTFPRLSGPKGSMIFFGGIVQFAEDVFVDKILGGPKKEAQSDLAHQIYRNAEIASQKYANVKWAMWLMYGSSPFWLLAVALLYNGR